MLNMTRLARQTVLALVASFSLVGLASAKTIEHFQGSVNFDSVPKRVVVLGIGSLDALDRLGVPVVGVPHGLLPDYLEKYHRSTGTTGSVSEPDYEAIYTMKPDVIIAEGRMLKVYDQLSKIAPTVMIYPQNDQFWSGTQRNWRMFGQLFGKEQQAEALIESVEAEIAAIRQLVSKQELDALMLMRNGGNLAKFDEKSRFSLVFSELGFQEAKTATNAKLSGTHGNLVSYEYIAESQPQVIFILDRDQAIGRGSSQAQAMLDNALVNNTPAAKEDKIIAVDGNAWYISSNGVTAVEQILADVKKALN